MTIEQYVHRLAADLKLDLKHKTMAAEFKDQAKELRFKLFAELARMSPSRKAEMVNL